MIEVAYVYFSWLAFYLPSTALLLFHDPREFVPWLLLTIAVLLVLVRLRKRMLWRVWIAVAFMPSTIICGSWMLVPWPLGLISAAGTTGCSTFVSVTTCLALNLALVFGCSALWTALGTTLRRAR